MQRSLQHQLELGKTNLLLSLLACSLLSPGICPGITFATSVELKIWTGHGSVVFERVRKCQVFPVWAQMETKKLDSAYREATKEEHCPIILFFRIYYCCTLKWWVANLLCHGSLGEGQKDVIDVDSMQVHGMLCTGVGIS
eukprot:XP_008651447.1 uncharacterized protein LOC103631768 [Zea mays]